MGLSLPRRTGRYSLSAICLPADFARARAQSVVGNIIGMYTKLQASAPVLVRRNQSQAGSLGGVATRLQASNTGTGWLFGNSFRSFVQDFEQPARRINVCLGQFPFVIAAVVHGRNHERQERQGVVIARQGKVRE
jgi:hypothetical protein